MFDITDAKCNREVQQIFTFLLRQYATILYLLIHSYVHQNAVNLIANVQCLIIVWLMQVPYVVRLNLAYLNIIPNLLPKKLRHGNCHPIGYMMKQIHTLTFEQTKSQHMKVHSSALLNKIVISFTDLSYYDKNVHARTNVCDCRLAICHL